MNPKLFFIEATVLAQLFHVGNHGWVWEGLQRRPVTWITEGFASGVLDCIPIVDVY